MQAPTVAKYSSLSTSSSTSLHTRYWLSNVLLRSINRTKMELASSMLKFFNNFFTWDLWCNKILPFRKWWICKQKQNLSFLIVSFHTNLWAFSQLGRILQSFPESWYHPHTRRVLHSHTPYLDQKCKDGRSGRWNPCLWENVKGNGTKRVNQEQIVECFLQFEPIVLFGGCRRMTR